MNNEQEQHGFRTADPRSILMRGLGVVMPPLLTIIALIWVWTMIESNVLRPTEWLVRSGVVWIVPSFVGETLDEVPERAIINADGSFSHEGVTYVSLFNGRKFLPSTVVRTVEDNADYFDDSAPELVSANAYWHRYVQFRFMPRYFVVPIFLLMFITLLFFVGRLFTFGLGRWFFRGFDAAIMGIPIVNKVYGSVKQITDFAFNEREIEFNNVVAIEYPRKGIWSIGFVTGNSLPQIGDVTGEPMLSVLMPTSPMPMTGFTVTVKKSDAIDLDMTIDEAIQFVVSCGVVVPAWRYSSDSDPSLRKKLRQQEGGIVLPESTAGTANDPSTVQ